MRRPDPLAVLAAANPVTEAPEVRPVASLDELIEACGSIREEQRRRPGRALLRLRLVAVLLVTAAAASAAGLLLTVDSDGPEVNVLAAAYAATSGGGVIEAEYLVRTPGGRRAAAPFRRREWLDTAMGLRREQVRVPAGAASELSPEEGNEVETAPGFVELWSGRPGRQGRITKLPSVPRGSLSSVPPGLDLFRELYKEGSLRLSGRERLRGRLLWKLEAPVAFAVYGRGSRPVPLTGVVVLVDPSTYLPVLQRTVSLMYRRGAVLQEVKLLRYRRLPSGSTSEALLSLQAVHPQAHVVEPHLPTPHLAGLGRTSLNPR
jgi:hypothetical protein